MKRGQRGGQSSRGNGRGGLRKTYSRMPSDTRPNAQSTDLDKYNGFERNPKGFAFYLKEIRLVLQYHKYFLNEIRVERKDVSQDSLDQTIQYLNYLEDMSLAREAEFSKGQGLEQEEFINEDGEAYVRLSPGQGAKKQLEFRLDNKLRYIEIDDRLRKQLRDILRNISEQFGGICCDHVQEARAIQSKLNEIIKITVADKHFVYCEGLPEIEKYERREKLGKKQYVEIVENRLKDVEKQLSGLPEELKKQIVLPSNQFAAKLEKIWLQADEKGNLRNDFIFYIATLKQKLEAELAEIDSSNFHVKSLYLTEELKTPYHGFIQFLTETFPDNIVAKMNFRQICEATNKLECFYPYLSQVIQSKVSEIDDLAKQKEKRRDENLWIGFGQEKFWKKFKKRREILLKNIRTIQMSIMMKKVSRKLLKFKKC